MTVSAQAAPSFKASAPIYAFNGGPSSFDRPYAFGAQPHIVNCKPPHTAEGIVGRLSPNGNCKPPRAAANVNLSRLMLRLFDNGSLPSQVGEGVSRSLSDEGTKVEWFFDASRTGVRHKWAADRKATRPQLRDPDFLAENAARGGVAVLLERQRLADSTSTSTVSRLMLLK